MGTSFTWTCWQHYPPHCCPPLGHIATPLSEALPCHRPSHCTAISCRTTTHLGCRTSTFGSSSSCATVLVVPPSPNPTWAMPPPQPPRPPYHQKVAYLGCHIAPPPPPAGRLPYHCLPLLGCCTAAGDTSFGHTNRTALPLVPLPLLEHLPSHYCPHSTLYFLIIF